VDPVIPPVTNEVAPVVLQDATSERWLQTVSVAALPAGLQAPAQADTVPASAEQVLSDVQASQVAFEQRSEDIARLPEPDALPGDRLDEPPASPEPILAPREVRVTAEPQASGDSVVRLPAGLVSVRLANGLALPAGIRFDARTGELRVDSRQLARMGQGELLLRGQDAQGRQTLIKVQVQAQAPQAALPGSLSLSQQLAGL
jgi:hypothetical protein